MKGLRPILRASGADLVMVVDGNLNRDQMLELAETCGREFIDFKLVPSCFQILVSGLQLESFPRHAGARDRQDAASPRVQQHRQTRHRHHRQHSPA